MKQWFVTAEITRRIAAQGELTTSLRGAVAESAKLVKEQFLIEKNAVDEASRAFDARLVSTLGQRIFDRIGMVTAQVTAQFVVENSETRSTVANLKGVLGAIGGERFQVVAEKAAALDSTQSGHIQMLSGMLPTESGVLRAESVKD